jgi:predicted nucleic acid-binding protein
LIVADTGAVVALIDRDERHHEALRDLYASDPGAWVFPWAIFPEVDYLVARYLGDGVRMRFLEDAARGAFPVEWGETEDLDRAARLHKRYEALGLGLVDGVVIATAERMRARAIATLDLRHFAAVEIRGLPSLLPRDL